MKTLTPEGWKAPIGYANGVVAEGTTIFVGGQVGWDAQQEFQSDDLTEQVRQTLQNVVDILAVGNARPEHIVRMTWFVIDKRSDIGRMYRQVIGRHFPAMSLVQVADLLEEGAKVEIEVTAVVPN